MVIAKKKEEKKEKEKAARSKTRKGDLSQN